MNFFYDIYLRDCRIILYGGFFRGVVIFNILLDGSFIVYFFVRFNNLRFSRNDFVMDSIIIFDGGLFSFMGIVKENNKLNVILIGSLYI